MFTHVELQIQLLYELETCVRKLHMLPRVLEQRPLVAGPGGPSGRRRTGLPA